MEKSHSNSIRNWLIVTAGLSSVFISLNITFPIEDDTLSVLASLVVTTFSFLAGFLIAAIAVVGNSTRVVAQLGWQTLVNYRDSYILYLNRYIFYFIAYLISIMCVILLFYTNPYRHEYLFRFFLGIIIFSFLVSFLLPYEIVHQHISIYDAIITKGKKEAVGRDKEKFKE